jgi:predicted ATP-grasp superfamily ATP-dependent carboligase
VIRQIDYPVVLKPRQGGGNYAIKFVYDIKDLKRTYLGHAQDNGLRFEQLLIQEYIPVKNKYSQVMIFKNGRPCAKFTDIHLRDYPFHGGAGCFRMSTTFPEIEWYTERILGYLNWHGIAEAEYITDQRDGRPYLIEINPRIWGGINSAISSGLNIPMLLLKIAFNETMRNDEISYRTGVKTRWLFGDLKTLIHQLKNSERKSLTLLENLNIFRDDITIDEFCKDDPIPLLVYPFSMLKLFVRKRRCRNKSYFSLKGEWA